MDHTTTEPLSLYLAARRARDANTASLLLALIRWLRAPQQVVGKLALR
jgi:hypothetical protein